MPAVTPPRPGDPAQIGPYRLLGLVGEGGQGSVFLAEDTSGTLPGQVALKLLHARFTGDARARSRFAAELAVAKRVSPFCTAQVLDADVEGHTPYIVSEFIDGPSLQAVLAEDGPQPGPALVRIAIGTITSLAAIHEAGIVHRDFKPSNVLLAPDGPRLIDFGVAKALDATGTLSSTVVGTPAYMAPEQIAGGPVGPEADVFAWGAAMVCAATGRPPFGQDSIPAVMHRILNTPPDLGVLPEPLREIAAVCLSKDPAQRPSAFQVLLRLLYHAGAQPPQQDASADGALHQGAEVAAAPVPPVLAPAGWGSGPGTPPPGPPPDREAYGYPTYPRHPAGGRRRGIGALVGAGAAALVALLLIGTVITVELLDRRPGGPATAPPQAGGTFTMLAPPPTSLDPSNAQWGLIDRMIVKQLFTGLVTISPRGSVQHQLATAIEADASCQNWTITLRRDTRFSNGEPVDATAVIRGWTRAAHSPRSLSSFFMSDIEGYAQARDGGEFSGVREVKADQLAVRLTESNCEFPKRLADPLFFPVPEVAGRHDNTTYNDRPIGNGPFQLESYVKDDRVVLVRNDTWAFGKANLDRVTIRTAGGGDAVAALNAVRSGEVDWAEVQPDNIELARSITSAELVSRPSTGLNFLVPITNKGPMAKREARQAVSYALDRRAISETYAHGLYPPATGLVPAAYPGFSGNSRCASCGAPDPTRAKTLAAEAEMGSDTRLEILVSKDSSYHQWGELVRQQLERTLGWRVELKIVSDLTTRQEALKDDDTTGLIPLGWVSDYASPYSFLRPLLAADEQPPDGTNYARWRNPQFDSALRTAVSTQNSQVMLSSFQQAEKLALDDMALIPVMNMADVRLVSKKFANLAPDFDGDPTLATASRTS